ncbi:hypothetical protein Q8A67_018979 [Cirrhinus molitorella]|uniref:Uncharacterized protein n=1 Tax=Cirrhinus molitorella TaxID=172907 RepID=A0AA88TF97_9TELE|nr:hypothetical protein Q8A67_018979 [Cirrhinus molitorella]
MTGKQDAKCRSYGFLRLQSVIRASFPDEHGPLDYRSRPESRPCVCDGSQGVTSVKEWRAVTDSFFKQTSSEYVSCDVRADHSPNGAAQRMDG